MKKIKNMLRNRNIIKILLLSIICAILIMGYFILNINPMSLMEKDCLVETIEDIEKCKDQYVTVKSSNIYDTEYSFLVDGLPVAHFVDIDIEGKSLIAIVKKDDKRGLINKEGVKEVRGKLEIFTNKGLKRGYDDIVNKYIENFGSNATEEQIKSTFVMYQLNAYSATKTPAIISLIALSIPFILSIIALLIVLKKTFFIKVISNKKIDKVLLENELSNGPYLYKSKDFILTNSFAIALYPGKIKVAYIDDLEWMYERKVTQIGSSKRKKYLILCFNNKKKIKIKFNNPEAEKVIQLINLKKPSMMAGYSKDIMKNWKRQK